MASDNEQLVRQAYKIAEEMDMAAWAAAFTEDGTFTDESIGVTWQGPRELPEQVENYHRAFPDMHRELYHVYGSGNMVVVQLALQGTHLGPLWLPDLDVPGTGFGVVHRVRGDLAPQEVDDFRRGTLGRFGRSQSGSAPAGPPDQYLYLLLGTDLYQARRRQGEQASPDHGDSRGVSRERRSAGNRSPPPCQPVRSNRRAGCAVEFSCPRAPRSIAGARRLGLRVLRAGTCL
jgi:SnoaL-like domain